jgi:hypothetical protein
MTRVILHIDRLVLCGIDSADTNAVSAGIRAQLETLLSEPDVAETLAGRGDCYHIKGGIAHFDQAGAAGDLGLSIGKRIAKGMTS